MPPRFFGIPFAAPLVGNLRWKAPRPVVPWEGIKECMQFGPYCPQPTTNPIHTWNDKMSEDCLFLNVCTPAKSCNEKHPVMVWIHGGGFYRGASSENTYKGDNLAKKGVVVVSINYRLGALGYLAHPQLSKESEKGVSGNYGLLDQMEALKWVQKNIASFGGDPDNVTIFGESAGAAGITTLMISPLTKGLFHGVIAESGNPLVGMEYDYPILNYHLKGVEKMGVEFADSLGCPNTPEGIEKLRKIPPEKLIKASNYNFGIDSAGYVFLILVDGWMVPDEFHKLLNSDGYNRVPILLGTNTNEGNAFRSRVTVKKYEDFIHRILGPSADVVLKLFPAKSD